jgi:hypothetical protein
MFELTNKGGGKYSDQRGFIFSPEVITVRSNLGESRTLQQALPVLRALVAGLIAPDPDAGASTASIRTDVSSRNGRPPRSASGC